MIIIVNHKTAVVLAAGLLLSCAPSQEETDFLARKALLQRQNLGIRELITDAEQGKLVPPDRFLIGIDEKIVRDLFRSQLPLARPIGKRFEIQLEKAEISLRDKYGAITIEGNLHRPSTPDRKTAVRVFGGLGAVIIEPESDMLSISIAIDHIDLLQAGILESIVGSGGKKFLADQGRELLQQSMPNIQVPVALGRKISIPSFQEGGLNLDSLAVPLDLSVERVIAAGGKLWVTLHAEVGEVTGAEEGLGVAVKKKPKGAAASRPPAKPPSLEPQKQKEGGV